VILKRWGTFFPQPIENEISIQIKNGRGKNLPDNELFTFWQIIYLTPCMVKEEQVNSDSNLRDMMKTYWQRTKNIVNCRSRL
jgi:hypothetical protein